MRKALMALAVVFLAFLLVLAVPAFETPSFEVVNHSPAAVTVVAAWRHEERRLGSIAPGASMRFSVNDEAGMTFTVRYADGRVVRSDPRYFTRGLEMTATISERGIETRYGFETAPK